MTRRKRNPPALTEAQERATGMRSIDANLDFGGGINLSTYDTKIEALQTKLTTYNNLLGAIDKLDLEIDKAEKDLRAYSGKMLASVGARYGRNSWEYGEAGGTNSTKHNPTETPDPASEATEPANLALPETNGKVHVKGLN